MKKVLKSLLVLVLVLVQVFPMFIVNAERADNGSIKEGTKGKITINNALVGETYEIYKILKLESYTKDKAYAYTAAEGWEAFLNETETKKYLSVNEEGYVSWIATDDAETIAEFARYALDYAEKNEISATESKEAKSTTIEFLGKESKGLELGYYLVDSSTGALCSLDTTDNEVVIREKNTVPTVDKTVEENGQYGDKNTADIGDEVKFKTEITVGAGAQNYVLYDKMSDGLTYQSITEVKLVSGQETKTLVENTDYVMKTVANTEYDFIMDFEDELEKTLKANDVIIVYYTAILNEDAVVEENGNENATRLVYGDGTETDFDYTYTYTFKFKLVKENAQNEQLTGAEFELYAADKKTKINLVQEDGTYRVATEEETNAEGFKSANIFAGDVIIKGLDEATYYLKEITPPNGYNLLADFVEVIVTANYDDEGVSTTLVSGAKDELVTYDQDKVTVINTTGNELPSTGGMGTVLFLTIGSLMVLGFGVLLVTKLRMAKMAL
ncbi:MAG: SpaH/EbpB family LPXTG-anchored major pilin [Bacilli bacterium]|nr:SpaH/EbpB family LPXTG-anchored major pilin [Bacilli bacterium]